jgi:P pilus assembly chaperone PapD
MFSRVCRRLGELMPLRLAIFVPVLLFSAAAPGASAMTVTPTQIEMTSTGRAGRSVITVVNDGADALPVELIVKRATLDEAGNAKTSPAGDDFLIMPPQALIAPGATQNFRIQWLGEPLLAASESFLIYVNQVPVRLSRRTSAVQIVISMGVMVNVAPPRGEPTLDVVGNGVVVDAGGRRRPTITVRNPSNVHALFSQATVHVSSGNWSQTLSSGELAQSIGMGLVQPGHRRRFVLPATLPANVVAARSTLEFKPRH